MARAPRRRLLDPAAAVDDRELADGEAVGGLPARLRHNVQSLSWADHQACPSLWRHAPLHPHDRRTATGPGTPSLDRPSPGAPSRPGGTSMTRMIAMAICTLAITVHAAPTIDNATAATVLAAPGGQRHHYPLGARVRPLLFWLGQNHAGDANLAKKQVAELVR